MPADLRRVKDLFVAALDFPNPADRAAFLDRECGPDAELRRRLDGLLAIHDQQESALERPLAQADPATIGHDNAANPDTRTIDSAPSLATDAWPGTSLRSRSAKAAWAASGWRNNQSQ
jgi:hypothetical protein